MDIWLLTVLSLLNFLHLFATAAWIGGMAINVLVLLPSSREALEPAAAGKFLGAVMKRFRRITYGAILLLVGTGVFMTALNKNYLGLAQFGNAWTQVILVKHALVAVMILVAVYAFEVLAPKVARTASKGPSPELAKLQRLQLRFAMTGLLMGLVVLLVTGIATGLSALP